MTPFEILNMASAKGVILSLTENGELKVIGGKAVIENLTPIIRENKVGLIATIIERESAPACCQNCKRLEIITVMNLNTPGCLYPATGEFSEGWRRLPEGMKQCLWINSAREARR
ncbi:MAG: hypothetical protein F9K32_04575 [Desulfobulbaceae bacterium]|nr:MAG: hypothetical protein F9K32_04575 [Desulfobulbaceae bacterium]